MEGVEELLREAPDVVVDAVAVVRVHRPAVDVEDVAEVAEVAEVGRFRIHQKVEAGQQISNDAQLTGVVHNRHYY